MLRRRLSAGALRAAAQAQQPTATQQTAALHSAASRSGTVTPASAAAKATINTPQQSKSLASAVLLNTQRSWKNETVVNLKAELKRRGLSQAGNKTTLIARLNSAEQSRIAPPVPPVSHAARQAAKALAQRSRSFSGTPPAAAKGKGNSSKGKDTSKDKDTSTTSTDQVVANSSDINTPKAAALPKAQQLSREEKTTAPGLPLDSPAKLDKDSDFNYKFPEPQQTKEREQTIPSLPHKFGKNQATEESTRQADKPKVVTVASASTHPSGGPVHGNEEVSDADALERKLQESEITADELAQLSGDSNIPFKLSGKGLPTSKGDAKSKADEALRKIAQGEITADELAKLSGLTDVPFKLSDIPLPPASEAGGEYKAITRPLNDQERTGAWVLGGVAAALVLLGWGGGKAKSKVEEKAGDVKDSVEEKAEEYKDKAGKKAGEVKDKAASVKDKVEDKVGEYKDKVNGEVRRVVGKIEEKTK